MRESLPKKCEVVHTLTREGIGFKPPKELGLLVSGLLIVQFVLVGALEREKHQ